MIKAIVAVDRNWGIGKNNDLLFHIPEDMRFFKAATSGRVVVMGSNTLKSFPGGRPLPNRINLVLWPGGEKREDCFVADSLDELKKEMRKYADGDIFVIGGAMFYRTMLPYCGEVYVTKVDADGGAEVFFENLDSAGWKAVYTSAPVTNNGYTFTFNTYANERPLEFFAD